MEPEVIKNIIMGGAIALGVTAPAIAMGLIASKGLDSIGRNPETANDIRTTMLLGMAFVESLAIFVLLVTLIIKFVA